MYTLFLLSISLSGCDKGKSCFCYEYDMDTGHQISLGYYEHRASCDATALWLGMYTDNSYFICDEVIE